VQLIKLAREQWHFDPTRPLGSPGGFGEVFEGRGPCGDVAVKRLRLSADDAAHRELRIAELLADQHYAHVLPVLDAGQDADSNRYFVVMPRAEGSLQDELDRRRALQEREAADVLRQIATGLKEVGELVHRDLKPANVLKHDGVWKIADFGIARFLEESTSLHTLKDCLSPPYAAPEQWRLERVTRATDIYALGCIAYALIHGQPPFGPDYRTAHLSAAPPELRATDPRLRSMVSAMLRKNPNTRPSLERVIDALSTIAMEPPKKGGSVGGLQQVNAVEAERRSQAEAQRAAHDEAVRQRSEIAHDGRHSFSLSIGELARVVRRNATEAQVAGTGTEMTVVLGNATLAIELDDRVIAEGRMPASRWDVVLQGALVVSQQTRQKWQHGASLYFVHMPNMTGYRWYEVSFKRNAFVAGPLMGPFPQPDLADADLAVAGGMHVTEVESRPTPADDEDVHAFVERWVERLVAAYRGRLCPF
jgi:eukaryotic-like serine/threonine-protein kinase